MTNKFAEVLNRRPFNGSFKPTCLVADMIGSGDYRDYLPFDSDHFVSDKAREVWLSRVSGEDSNVLIIQDERVRNQGFFLELIRRFNPAYKVAHVLSIVGIPGAFCREKGFSVDHRTLGSELVGTAHFTLNYLLTRDIAEELLGDLKYNSNQAFDIIQDMNFRHKGKAIDLFRGYGFDRSDMPYKIEIYRS